MILQLPPLKSIPIGKTTPKNLSAIPLIDTSTRTVGTTWINDYGPALLEQIIRSRTSRDWIGYLTGKSERACVAAGLPGRNERVWWLGEE